jgi:hypothetical protein
MRTHFVVVAAPRFEFLPSIGEVKEHVDVEAFVTKRPVEALDKAIFHRSPGPDEVNLHSVAV